METPRLSITKSGGRDTPTPGLMPMSLSIQ